MNRTIRGQDLNGQQIVHMEEIAPGDWRGVDFERTAGICVYTWETVITRLADLIGGGHVYRLDIATAISVDIDRAGNIWHKHEYLAPHQYLPMLIPETW